MTDIRQVGNFDNQGGQFVLYYVILDLRKSITYFMAEDNLAELQELYLEQFAAAIYLLAIMGEHYKFGPGVQASTVQRWRDMYFPMYDERYAARAGKPDPLRANIVAAFERLEVVAKLLPPYEWRRKE